MNLGCGKNYRPEELKDSKFYFFKGKIIEIYGTGTLRYRVYSPCGRSGFIYDKDDPLYKPMKEVVEYNKEEEEKEEVMARRIKRFLENKIKSMPADILQEVAEFI